MSIKELVKFIYDVSKAAFTGMTHKDVWLFYNDALKMMSKIRGVWMNVEGYYAQWLISHIGATMGQDM